jgi:acyl-coenzyme A synthetase/AMP-(fatty) acid ligase
METYPLVHRQTGDGILGWADHKPVSIERFLTDVVSLSRNLPDCPRVLNICHNRYRFLVGFAAALVKRQTNILPPNKSPKGLQSVASQFPEIYCLTDGNGQENFGVPLLQYPSESVPQVRSLNIPEIATSHLAAIAFTSGSTGAPQPHLKSWGSMVKIARSTGHRLISENLNKSSIIATVPPQHMYGLETSIMLPLQQNVALHDGHPFFPEDIREALESVPQKRILVTTPIHLKACVESSVKFPEISLIVSATAPLSQGLAEVAEQLYDTEVFEIYGCTEAGSLATRKTTRGNAWQLLNGIHLTGNDDRCYIDATYLSQPVKLPDIIKNSQNGLFELQGRSADLINIGGKRTSLGELNHRLNEINGVEDGAYFVPPQKDSDHKRLIAFIVAKDLREKDILKALRQHLDPVFLPRPIYFVDRLLRTSSGKLTRENLLEIYSRFSN